MLCLSNERTCSQDHYANVCLGFPMVSNSSAVYWYTKGHLILQAVRTYAVGNRISPCFFSYSLLNVFYDSGQLNDKFKKGVKKTCFTKCSQGLKLLSFQQSREFTTWLQVLKLLQFVVVLSLQGQKTGRKVRDTEGEMDKAREHNFSEY